MRRTLLCVVLFAAVLCPGIILAQSWQWGKTSDKCIPFSSTGSSAHAWPMATDAEGNVYMAMWSSFDSVTIGSYNLHSAIYQTQVILTKYDNAGNLLWSRSSTGGNTKPIDIAVDASGSVFLYGFFSGDIVQFGSLAISRTAPVESKTTYIIKYDKNGTYQWKVNAGTISMGTDKESYGSIAADGDGNVYAAATYYNTLNVGTYSLANNGYEDISVAKYSPAGALMWAKRFGGTGFDRVSAITVNKDNKILLAGEFSSPSITFGSSNLNFSASCAASSYACFNIYIAQLGTDGNVAWARQSQGSSRVMSIVTDSLDDIYIGGSINDNDVSFSGRSLAGNVNDPFLAKYSSTGEIIRVVPFTQTLVAGSSQAIWDLTIDACNNIWVSGGMDTIYGNGVYVDSTIILPVPQKCIDPLYIVAYTAEGMLYNYAVLGSGGLSNSGIAADKVGNIYLCGYYNASATLQIGGDSAVAMPNVERNYFIGKYTPNRSCIPNSVTSVAGVHTLDIYPNPATNVLNIDATTAIGKVTICDMLGKTVYSATFSANNAAVNIGALVPGIYVLRMGNGEVRKFVKD